MAHSLPLEDCSLTDVDLFFVEWVVLGDIQVCMLAVSDMVILLSYIHVSVVGGVYALLIQHTMVEYMPQERYVGEGDRL